MVATAKVSLSMDRHALALAKTAANRTGTSLSSLVNAALERHLGEVLAELASSQPHGTTAYAGSWDQGGESKRP